MRALLGGLCFVLSMLCAGGLFYATVRFAWDPIEDFNPALGYFGFGIPMLILGIATAELWEQHPRLLNWGLGGSCLALGIANVLGLLALLAGWVGLLPARPAVPGAFQGLESSQAVGCLMAFGLPMLLCGDAGIGILLLPSLPSGSAAEAAHAPAVAASAESSKPWWDEVLTWLRGRR